VARDGKEALDAILRDPPDLVLLDVMMPRKTGLEVCQEVRAEARLQGVRILMLTAKGRETDVAKGLALGANAYVTKPFSTRDLVARVRRCWRTAVNLQRRALLAAAAPAWCWAPGSR
jgi:two-component system alkaline phosphatase synthesis response regulator PhoP